MLRSAETGTLGPVRRVLAAPFVCVVGTECGSSTKNLYEKAAVEFANAWALLGGGVTSIVTDTDVLQAGIPMPNAILFGGPNTNAYSRALQLQLPAPTVIDGAARSAQQLESGFAIGNCTFKGLGGAKLQHALLPRLGARHARLIHQ